jgi:hypothetical protein
MNNLTSLLKTIVKDCGGSPKDWKAVMTTINGKPDEYIIYFMI